MADSGLKHSYAQQLTDLINDAKRDGIHFACDWDEIQIIDSDRYRYQSGALIVHYVDDERGWQVRNV